MAYRHGILDKLVVVDLEATCWKNKAPKGQKSEIIEIGLCTLDLQTGDRAEMESILVKPIMSKVSTFCTKLTSLTQTQVDGGISFEAACEILKEKYQTLDRTWASYGDYDREKFQEQCREFGVDYPFSKRHINVKNIFAIVHGLSREVGMAKAMKMRGFDMEGRHHRGHYDAWNTAKLMEELMIIRRNAVKIAESSPEE